jgi:hypothetical protein
MSDDSKHDVHFVSYVTLTHYLHGKVHIEPNSIFVNYDILNPDVEKLENIMARKFVEFRMYRFYRVMTSGVGSGLDVLTIEIVSVLMSGDKVQAYIVELSQVIVLLFYMY